MNVSESKTGCENDRSFGFVCAALFAVLSLFVTAGIKYAQSSDILNSVSFYGRYDGIGTAIPDHITAAVGCSVMCLTELFVIYLMSFSTLLIPTILTLTGFRGFIAGIAYSGISDIDSVSQFILYLVLTAAMCIFAVSLRRAKNDGRILQKTVMLSVFAGASVIGEFIISYIT